MSVGGFRSQALSLLDLVLSIYPPDLLGTGFERTWPFFGAEGLTFAFLLGALIVAGVIVRVDWIRAALAVVGILTLTYVLPFETSGPVLVTAWAALTVASMAAWTLVVSPRLPPEFAERNVAALGLPAWLHAIEEGIADVSRAIRPAFAWMVPIPIAAAIGHLAVVDYPITNAGPMRDGIPYIAIEGWSAAAVVAGLGLVGWLGSRSVRLACGGVAMLVVSYTLWFEVSLPILMVAWGAATIASLLMVRRIVVVDTRPPVGATLTALAERVPYLAAGIGLAWMALTALWYAGPFAFVQLLVGERIPTGTPFVDDRTIALLALAGTLAVAGWVWGGVRAGLVGAVGAGLTVAWLLPFEIRPAYAVAGWAALSTAGFWLLHRVPSERRLLGVPSLGLLVAGGLVVLGVVAPPTRLVVDATTVVLGLPILTDATIGLTALALAVAAGVWLHPIEPVSRYGPMAVGIIVVYGLSVGLVDFFQRQVGTRPLEDLQRDAQLGLSLLWSILGGVTFAVGLRTRNVMIRLSGLALLGLATAKVFLVDLSALDIAYRVMSLVALGVLLLVSAFVYARHQHHITPA